MELQGAKLVVLFFALNVGRMCKGQDPPLRVTILEGDQQLRAGQSANLTCSINRKMTLIVEYDVIWAHRSLATRAERNLTFQASQGPDASPDHFEIESVELGDDISFQLKILSASESEDGEYMCKLFPKKSGAPPITKLVTVTVLHDVEHVSLMFDGMESVTGEDNPTIELEEGEHGVTCEVRGFNGELEIRFLLGAAPVHDAVELKTELDTAASLQARARRFLGVAVLPRLVLTAADTGKKLTCVAAVASINAKHLTASIPLQVISLQPVVHCHDKIWASVTDIPLNITCIVEHVYTAVQDFVWENGRTGETMSRESANNVSRVFITGVNATHSVVTLTLYDLEKESISNYFLEVITKVGVVRQAVVLHLQDAEGQDLVLNSASSSVVSAAISILSRLCLLAAAYLCGHLVCIVQGDVNC